ELRSFVDLVSVGITVGEVDFPAQIARVRANRFGEDLRRLSDVTLRPGKLEEVAAPDHLRRSVEIVLVDAQRGEDPVAELAFEPLRERRDDPHSLGIEPDAHAAVVLAPDVARIGRHRLVGGVPRFLSQGGLFVRLLRVRLPVVERRQPPVRLERSRLDGKLLLEDLLELLLDALLVPLAPQLVELLAPPRRSLRGRRRTLCRWRARRRRLRDEQEREQKHGSRRRTTAADHGQPDAPWLNAPRKSAAGQWHGTL